MEKLPGGSIEDCRVLKGVMFQKDVVAPGRMRRKISNPRVLLLDCPLEYKKGENQTNVELSKEEDWCATSPSTLRHSRASHEACTYVDIQQAAISRHLCRSEGLFPKVVQGRGCCMACIVCMGGETGQAFLMRGHIRAQGGAAEAGGGLHRAPVR